MLKMLLDPMGGIVLTNDGNAILREVRKKELSNSERAISLLTPSRTLDLLTFL
jgi:chaperonin GroEL (HSP60 family)